METKHLNSCDVSGILKYFKQTILQHQYSRDQVSICDKKTNDFNHALELDNLNYAERAKLATKQQENLKNRRISKDYIYECQPLVDLLDSPEGIRFIRKLETVLGEMRKQEKLHECRTYKKRSE